MKRLFKIKFPEIAIVGRTPYPVEYIGKSKLDGYCIYSIEIREGQAISFESLSRAFVVNRKPGYTLKKEDFELISSLEDVITDSKLIEVKPLSPPSGILHYMDFVYESYSDPRLLLLL